MAGETYGIALVPSTRQAMAGEALAKAAGLAVRIIPTPGKLDASCGFSLRYELADEAALTALLDEKGLAWAALYHACRRGLRVTYTKCKEG